MHLVHSNFNLSNTKKDGSNIFLLKLVKSGQKIPNKLNYTIKSNYVVQLKIEV